MASNPFGVAVPVLDYTKFGAPTTQSYHGVGIMVGGNIVGRLQNWQVQGIYQRAMTPVRELNFQTFGRVVDIVPGINEPYKASAERVEVWENEMEKELGYSAVWTDLLDQTYPFSAKEIWKKGGAMYRITDYLGMWFDNKDHNQWTPDGDARVTVSASFSFVSKLITYSAS